MRGAQDNDQHNALVAFHLKLLLPPLGGSGQTLQTLDRVSSILPSTSGTSHFRCQAITANLVETDCIRCHRWHPPENGKTLSDRSPMRFQSKFQSSCLPLHFLECSRNGISRKTQLDEWGCQKGCSFESYDSWLPATLQCCLAIPNSTKKKKDTRHDVAYALTPFPCLRPWASAKEPDVVTLLQQRT